MPADGEVADRGHQPIVGDNIEGDRGTAEPFPKASHNGGSVWIRTEIVRKPRSQLPEKFRVSCFPSGTFRAGPWDELECIGSGKTVIGKA